MADKKRIMKIDEKLNKLSIISELKTQELRVKLISELENLFNYAIQMARGAENRDSWVKIAGYIAQTINSLTKAYDETRFNEDLQRLKEMIRRAKEKLARQAREGTPIT
ncbi:hypothetical protein J7L27_07670 [Candidatus Bathyarchaeota archaeon]|nr:hypothetical protein [Candidatus Bathyarchaeota archaeon]